MGTVKGAEFQLTLSISFTCIVTLGLQAITVATTGLLIGGLAAAPLGAVLAKRLATRVLLLVGIVPTATSLVSLCRAILG